MRAALRSAADLVGTTLLVVLLLWTIGACAGVVTLGYCMVAGC